MDQKTWDEQKAASLAAAEEQGKEPWQMLTFGKNEDDRIAAHGPLRDEGDSEASLFT